MGIIVALLVASEHTGWAYRAGGQEISWWIIVACYAAMALGTMSVEMAYRENDGTENYQVKAGWRFLC